MRTIRELACSEMKDVYETYMRKDFPLMELRPWVSIRKAWDDNRYLAYSYYEDKQFLAYAAFYFSRSNGGVLLDYYAVVSDLRGRGLGSAFLQGLLPLVPAAKGIFVEAESVASAEQEEERHIRERRLSFYGRNGAKKTGVNCRLFGVDYNILYFPGAEENTNQDAMFDTICSLYQDLYRPVYGRLCRPYRANG